MRNSMADGKIIYLTDRSAAEVDDTCGMKFWWNRKEGGQGIVPAKVPAALAEGAQIHEDLATIAEWTDLSESAIKDAIAAILATADIEKMSTSEKERLYRRLGWVTAWALWMEPNIRAGYETVHVEKELVLDRSPLWVACTPDRLLRDKNKGWLKYIEYKSTLSAGKKWTDSWRYAIQLHINIAAVQEELKEDIKYAQVIGLQKGYVSQSDGHLAHPYVWGWWNQTTSQWTHNYDEARTSQWVRMPVWEYEGGVVEWVKRCGRDEGMKQFPATNPLFLDRRMLNEWIDRRTAREEEITAVEDLCSVDLKERNIYFEKRMKNCLPPYGDACPYLLPCWNAEIANNPLKSPEFVKRVPHHDLETIGVI
jgi:hypothetical protein